jgi:hypothetical protein
MFKQVTAVILLLALSLNILNRVVIYADYYSNMALYAKNCENKSIPQMHCNGKCQMMKKIKEQEKNESQAPERKVINDALVISQSFPESISPFGIDLKNRYNTFSSYHVVNMPRSFFHPPGA